MTMDLHSRRSRGSSTSRSTPPLAAPVLVDYYVHLNIPDLTVVAPDIGSVKMGARYAKRAQRQPRDRGQAPSAPGRRGDDERHREVEGRNVVIFDDVVSTGSTLVEAAAAVKRAGAKDVYAGCTPWHPVRRRGGAHSALRAARADRDGQHPARSAEAGATIKVHSVAGLLGEAIRRIHDEESLSSLFI